MLHAAHILRNTGYCSLPAREGDEIGILDYWFTKSVVHMLEKIFNWTKKRAEEGVLPQRLFGRYSDNNKPVEKVEKWNEAEALFKEKKYAESIKAFFDYLLDDDVQNVVHEQQGAEGQFYFYQGSKIIKGFYNTRLFEAEVVLARMLKPSVPVMRRLLEMNFHLYYTRYALSDDRLCMLFDTDIETANPGKLYYGLKELSTKADKQDDLLIQDFTTLYPHDVEHIISIPDTEKEIKYNYLKKWIGDTLQLVNSIDAEKFSGGIAYVLLALAFRIDYLITPEGKLLLDLEKIVDIYFKKDERSVMEKNSEMVELLQKLGARAKEEVLPYLFRSKYTFSIVMPQNYKTIADAIYNANQNVAWYRENKLLQVAAVISEYGFAYCQYSYSLPRPVSELFQLFMMVNYSDYFKDLGLEESYHNKETHELSRDAIVQKIENILEKWQKKYPQLNFKTDKLKYDDLVSFNISFTNEVEQLNLTAD